MGSGRRGAGRGAAAAARRCCAEWGGRRDRYESWSVDRNPNNSNYYQTVSNAWASTGIGLQFYLGDVNGDLILNIQDIVLILHYILGNNELTEFQFFSADMNQDQMIDIFDIIQVVNEILYGI